jgi:membrane fusion protein, multidrug efflux system
MKKIWILLWLSMFCLSCQEEATEEEVLRPVRFEEVMGQSPTTAKTFSGTAKAETELAMSFKVSGTLEYLNAKVGQKVKAGELIARIDASDYRLKYEQAVASLYQGRARAKNAASNYERFRLLYENNNVALSDFEAAEAEYESAQANVRALSKQVQQAALQVDYTELYAPMDGIVTEVPVEANENVQAGETIVHFSSSQGIEVSVDVPDVYIPFVKKEDTVKVIFSAMKQDTLQALVTEVAYAKGQSRSAYPVTVQLIGQDERIRPGMSATVRFSAKTKQVNVQDMVIVPAFALGEDQEGKHFVYVLEQKDEKLNTWIARKRKVTVGEMKGEVVSIEEGLQQGEKVVTAGVSRLEDGMTVTVLQ